MTVHDIDVLVIGAGPAGLMAADVAAKAGKSVLVAEAMPSPARKFLMAGKSGLNLTKDEKFPTFMKAYGSFAKHLKPMIEAFGPDQIADWAIGLEQEIFTGTTGRVFPKAMKASPLLRAWMQQLSVDLKRRWRWTGWNGDLAVFQTPEGEQEVRAKATVLALGGGSWPRLGSDGRWVDALKAEGVAIRDIAPSNAGVRIEWSSFMSGHFGKPVKGVRITSGSKDSRGEIIITQDGFEGGGVYTLTPQIRSSAELSLDLKPDLRVEELTKKLASMPAKANAKDQMRRLGLAPPVIALVQEFARPVPRGVELAPILKNLVIPHQGPMGIEKAISSAGGVKWNAVDAQLMLTARPGVFVAGEMLDWEAPTGGYLLTGCFATGRWAGAGALSYLAEA